MFAVISLGGKQYRVRKGEYLTVDRLAHEAGSTFSPARAPRDLGRRRLPIDASDLAKVTVTARVDEHLLGPKIRVFQYKPKKSSKKARGHRSRLSRITIEEIAIGTAKKAAAKPAEKAEAKPAASRPRRRLRSPPRRPRPPPRRRPRPRRSRQRRSPQLPRSRRPPRSRPLPRSPQHPRAGGGEEARRRARTGAGGVRNGT